MYLFGYWLAKCFHVPNLKSVDLLFTPPTVPHARRNDAVVIDEASIAIQTC
jgi:hypothetical protein